MSLNYSVNITQCTELTADALASGLTPFLHSSPGCGKSSIIRQIAEDFDLELIDLRLSTMDSVDLSGMPMIDPDTRQVDWKPFDIFPLENTPLPLDYKTQKPKAGWLLFLDELNSASEAVIAAAYNVVLDRRIGTHKLHPQCFIACAGNREEDRAITTSMGSAMTSRLVHLNLEPTMEEWVENVAIPQKYDFRIPAFLQMNPKAFMNFDPKYPTDTYCCPRTWEFVNKQLTWFLNDDPKLEHLDRKLPLLAGTINAGTATEFIQFCRVINNIPSFASIVSNPKSATLPEDLAGQWAVITMCINKVKKDNIKEVAVYIDRFKDRAMQTLFVRGAVRLNKNLITTAPIQKFNAELALEIAELEDVA